MSLQVLDIQSLIPIFRAWASESANVNSDPLSKSQQITKNLGKKFSDFFNANSQSISHLKHGRVEFLHLKTGIDFGDIACDTPSEFQPLANDQWWPAAQFTLGVLGAISLKSIAYQSENQGVLFQNIVAGKSEKSTGELRGHTDAAAFPFQGESLTTGEGISASPDFVVLTGLRNPKDVPTWVVPTYKIFERVFEAPQGRWILGENCYTITPQPSFDSALLPKGYRLENRELLGVDSDKYPAFRFRNSGISVENIKGETADRAEQILKDITATLESALRKEKDELYEKIIVAAGDILIINNRFALHGRGKVTDHTMPEIGGKSRWLLRTYGYKERTIGFSAKNDHIMLP